MKALPLLLAAVLMFTVRLHAEDSPDLRAPKAEAPRLLRVLLHLAGSPRLIDYPDVEKIICCEPTRITFETQDGSIVMHQGSFTVIQPRTANATTSAGGRFYDVK